MKFGDEVEKVDSYQCRYCSEGRAFYDETYKAWMCSLCGRFYRTKVEEDTG